MKLEIIDIKDSGNLEKERTIFKVIQPANLGAYMVAQSVEVAENAFSSSVEHVFWLPDQELQADDLVVLYTKKGEKGSAINTDGSTTYFYYWGLDQALSSKDKACVVIFEATWKVKNVPNPSTNDNEEDTE